MLITNNFLLFVCFCFEHNKQHSNSGEREPNRISSGPLWSKWREKKMSSHYIPCFPICDEKARQAMPGIWQIPSSFWTNRKLNYYAYPILLCSHDVAFSIFVLSVKWDNIQAPQLSTQSVFFYPFGPIEVYVYPNNRIIFFDVMKYHIYM